MYALSLTVSDQISIGNCWIGILRIGYYSGNTRPIQNVSINYSIKSYHINQSVLLFRLSILLNLPLPLSLPLSSIPQLVLTVLLQEKWDPTVLHITGTILVVLSSLVYAALRYRAHKLEQKEQKPEGTVYQVEQRSI